MKDIQNRYDDRGIDIQRVGVKNVHIPLRIAKREGSYQEVLANVSMDVSLPMQFKGTHMSRFQELLSAWSTKALTNADIRCILKDACDSLNATSAQISIKFKYFVEKEAPVSKKKSVLDYNCEFNGRMMDSKFEFTMAVEVPVTSCCPCSKEISEYGAHNQRTMIKLKVSFAPKEYLWIEDVVEILQTMGSAQIYSLLKREDEKYVTEMAYNNTKFVEDILRDVVIAMKAEDKVLWFEVECESFESIHNHSAFAYHVEDKRMV